MDMKWIRQEDGASHALYEDLATHINIKIHVPPVSRKISKINKQNGHTVYCTENPPTRSPTPIN